jgi:hypothetical protein
MLEIAPHELEDLEFAFTPFLFAGALVFEEHFGVGDPGRSI